jgi:hypothetical protein
MGLHGLIQGELHLYVSVDFNWPFWNISRINLKTLANV